MFDNKQNMMNTFSEAWYYLYVKPKAILIT